MFSSSFNSPPRNLDGVTSPERFRKHMKSIDIFTGSRSICDNIVRKFDQLILSNDFKNRPLYVCPDGHIFLETFSPFYKPAYEFLISIAEPVTRPQYIQEYQISSYSLYTAVSIGLTGEEIIHVLSILSKVEIDSSLIELIKETVQAVGKLKLILKNKRYFVQSSELSLLQFMATKLDDYRIKEKVEGDVYDEENGFIIPDLEEEMNQASAGLAGVVSSLEELGLDLDFDIEDNPKEDYDIYFSDEPPVPLTTTYLNTSDLIKANDNNSNNNNESEKISKFSLSRMCEKFVRRFEVEEKSIRKVRQIALSLNIPFTDEYDFRSDVSNPDLPMDLRNTTKVRAYQEKALTKMFGGSRAKSGIIVLPCGAGKTLVGITAACTIRKSTIVFCDANLSILQWYDQFLKYTTIDPSKIFIFNSDNKISIPEKDPCVVISTYSIFTAGKSELTRKVKDMICKREWGLMILDEVQGSVAETFARVNDQVKAHSKLGLTATLVREDDKIDDLNYIIGPRLYEANWIDLSEQGFIARVKCYEIWCKMPGEYYKEYLLSKDFNIRRILSALNPNKINVVERLIRYHESRGDKILVFADILGVLDVYAEDFAKNTTNGYYNRPCLKGETKIEDRRKVFDAFRNTNRVNCIFLSSIGDKAIDLPDANVLIQICSRFGARMQEAQRLGRILRRKPGRTDDFNAFFYTVISEDTMEMYYSRKRQQFLTNQGYTFEIVNENLENKWPIRGDLLYSDSRKQTNLLNKITNKEVEIEEEEIEIESFAQATSDVLSIGSNDVYFVNK
ncbi:TFIIH basal transcription factor complex helicase repB subunit [Tritrichomonas foetus]|uniref:DNA 3'-5' helicase n=1 Tax=Tritrichomonas foetus TaxID=1144522 RepID=A0A1J4JP59_9EUKA|nr:TFIIH basal transcription factor complex helicase repB subunit [Tritrichomonas foetus]|eukprot:OHS99301.1 TFIIH basal transcription factor complex helicase repB subunit [Tritrichomonas foetus]